MSLQDWTLKAILNGENAILIQSGKEALISRAEVGATLPDGSRLLALKGDIAVVERDGCRMDRHLYPRAPNSDSSECNLATLQKDRKDLQKLFANGVMDWEGFEDIDWDE